MKRTEARPRSVAPLVATWVGAAVGLGLLLSLARSAQGPLDDADQAWQRPGFLDAGDLPAPAPAVVPGIPSLGRPMVVFFVRPGGLADLCRSLARRPLPDKAGAIVVVAGTPPSGGCTGAGTVVGDPAGAVAEDYGMRDPRGGGPPVGYAVVDATGTIRYRTLDPDVAGQLGEVATMVGALR